MAPSPVYTKLPTGGDIETTVEKKQYHVVDDPTNFTKPLVVVVNETNVRNNKNRNVRGCCMTFCLIVAIILSLLVAIFIGMAVAGYMWMANQVEKWSVTTPNNNIPTLIVPDTELQIFKDRTALFFDSIQSIDPVDKIDDLTVTSRAVNGLAGSSDYLRGNLFTTMTSNQVVIDVSLPLEGLPGGKGRFIVGTETITWDPETSTFHDRFVPRQSDVNDLPQPVYWDVTFSLTKEDGPKSSSHVYDLEIVDGQIFGWVVPQDFIDSHQNLLDGFYHCECGDDDCRVIKKMLDSITNILLEDDQVVLQAEPVVSSSMMMHHGNNNNMMKVASESSSEDESTSEDESSSEDEGTRSSSMMHGNNNNMMMMKKNSGSSDSSMMMHGNMMPHSGGSSMMMKGPGHHRALRAVAEEPTSPSTTSSSFGWKLNLARRLVGI